MTPYYFANCETLNCGARTLRPGFTTEGGQSCRCNTLSAFQLSQLGPHVVSSCRVLLTGFEGSPIHNGTSEHEIPCTRKGKEPPAPRENVDRSCHYKSTVWDSGAPDHKRKCTRHNAVPRHYRRSEMPSRSSKISICCFGCPCGPSRCGAACFDNALVASLRSLILVNPR